MLREPKPLEPALISETASTTAPDQQHQLPKNHHIQTQIPQETYQYSITWKSKQITDTKPKFNILLQNCNGLINKQSEWIPLLQTIKAHNYDVTCLVETNTAWTTTMMKQFKRYTRSYLKHPQSSLATVDFTPKTSTNQAAHAQYCKIIRPEYTTNYTTIQEWDDGQESP